MFPLLDTLVGLQQEIRDQRHDGHCIGWSYHLILPNVPEFGLHAETATILSRHRYTIDFPLHRPVAQAVLPNGTKILLN
jgi:hypothetical protein